MTEHDPIHQHDPDQEWGQNGGHWTSIQRNAILEVLDASPKPLRPRDVAKHTEWSCKTVLVRIRELYRAGRVGKDPMTGGYYVKVETA